MSPIMAGALAISAALDPFAPGLVSLKWPNDVLLNGRKVAGILAESLWQSQQLQAVILGMGVNLAVDFAGTDLASTATSLTQHTDQAIDRAELLATIVLGVERWLAAPDLWQHWKDRLITLGQPVTINGDIRGVAQSVQEDGALVVLLDSGQTQTVWAGDVGIL
jgi:BirA family biotin operon repressor/biotin-[acetyl-CoA-carboxylase] ligase